MNPQTRLAYEVPARVAEVLGSVAWERLRQYGKWGEQNHPDGTGRPGDVEHANFVRRCTEQYFAVGVGTWRDILEEEVMEALAESDETKLRTELIQVAAVAVAWIEHLERRARASD